MAQSEINEAEYAFEVKYIPDYYWESGNKKIIIATTSIKKVIEIIDKELAGEVGAILEVKYLGDIVFSDKFLKIIEWN